MKTYFLYIIFFITQVGCAPSVIKIKSLIDDAPISQYGLVSQRSFEYNHDEIELTFEEKWETNINGGFAMSSVSIYDSAIFINDLSGRIFCFSLKNGKTLGQLKFKGSIFTTPIIHRNNIVFIVADAKENFSTIIFYDFFSGSEIASDEFRGTVTNQMLKLNDGVVLVTEQGECRKYGFNGNLLWKKATGSRSHSNPAANQEIIAFGNDDGEVCALRARSGELLYRKKIGSPFFGGAVISGDELFIGNNDGSLYSLELKNGNIKWAANTQSRITMEAVVHNNDIYIGNLKGDFFKLSRKTGAIIWKKLIGGLLNITPIITNNILILPDANEKIYFINNSSGEIQNTIELEGRVKLSPVIRQNLLIVGFENGNLRAYEISKN